MSPTGSLVSAKAVAAFQDIYVECVTAWTEGVPTFQKMVNAILDCLQSKSRWVAHPIVGILCDEKTKVAAKFFVDLFQWEWKSIVDGLEPNTKRRLNIIVKGIKNALATKSPEEVFKEQIVILLHKLSTMEFRNSGIPYTMFHSLDTNSLATTLTIQKVFTSDDVEAFDMNDFTLGDNTEYKDAVIGDREELNLKTLLNIVAEAEWPMYQRTNRRRVVDGNTSKWSIQDDLIFDANYRKQESISEKEFLLIIYALCERAWIEVSAETSIVRT